MYTDNYPNLHQKYKFDNFEEIIGALEGRFHGLFNLAVLEEEIKNKRNGSYTEFFDQVMSKLNSSKLFTEAEVSAKIADLLVNDDSVRNCFLKRMVFVPPLDGQPSTQLGFLEKTATGQLKAAEPVTYLDMLRLVQNLKELAGTGYGRSPTPTNFAVYNLNDINSENSEDIAVEFMLRDALVVNFNRDPKGEAKWGVIDLRNKHNPQIYCETPLSEAEKREVEQRLPIKYKEVQARQANNLPSTGYTAIAWLDQNISQAWNFDTSSDFNNLLGSYVFVQFRGDGTSIEYTFSPGEYQAFCTQEFKTVNNASYGSGYSSNSTWQGYMPVKFASMSVLPEINKQPITPNSLYDVMQAFGSGKINESQFYTITHHAYRSNIPGFARTMTEYGNPRLLTVENGKAELRIPDKIDEDGLRDAHYKACRPTNTNAAYFNKLTRTPHHYGAYPQEDMASAMVIHTFRSQSKQAVLNIKLPAKFALNAEESKLIINQVQENAYLTELNINSENQSLTGLKAALLPALGRNRWLKECGYLPPMVDNFWQRAARYWLLHLNEHTDLAQNKNEHKLFKQCVEDMGTRGLEEVLAFLKNPELCDNLLGIYGRNRPLFYLACQQHEVKEYLDLLIGHLSQNHPFPFSELSAAYQPGHDKSYLSLLGFVNERDSFEQIYLTDCLRHKNDFAGFLRAMAKEAQQGKWTGLVVIPELEMEKTATEEYRELRSLYRQINNIILNNRHLKQGAEISQKIKDSSNFAQGKGAAGEGNKTAKAIADSINLQFAATEKGPWPLQRGGGVQLQMQQQQEVQQQRQMQKETQRLRMVMKEEVITAEMVTYKNIDKLLGHYYKNYKAENACDPERFAPLKYEGESELESFFHTWINAEPSVKASQVISAMTQEAAKMLLRHHTRVSSGLDLNNLPRGFYTQRSKDGQLILCYNTEMGYSNGINTPLTLDLQVSKPVAEFWEGDFRQFDIDFYLANNPKLDSAKSFQPLVLFEVLQPAKNYQKDWEKFKTENPNVSRLVKNEQRVLQHWPVFIQAWQYGGVEAVKTFLSLKDQDLLLNVPTACSILYAKQPELMEWAIQWARSGTLNQTDLCALGQVYYKYGEETLALLTSKLRQIEQQLGKEFFQKFHSEVLRSSENYNSFINPAFFQAIDSMMETLSPARAKPLRDAWLSFCSKHLQHVPAEQVDVLWKAFDYFVKELTDMGLALSGDEFADLEPRNMLVTLDRILDSLRSLPAQDEKARLLKSLGKLDLTHGGVHYAIQQERFKYFDKDLELYDFVKGKPTYAPDLKTLYQWDATEAALNIRRTLATRPQFTYGDYTLLSKAIANDNPLSRHQLMWLLYTRYDARQVAAALDTVRGLPVQLVANIAQHLHQAAFQFGHDQLAISLSTLEKTQDLLQGNRANELLRKYPHGNFLEALNLLVEGNNQAKMEPFLGLFETQVKFPSKYPQFLKNEAYKAATLFGALSKEQLQAFIDATSDLSLAVQNELEVVLKHLLSVNFEQGNPQALHKPENWKAFLKAIKDMNEKPVNRSAIRKAFITSLNDQDIAFKYSRSGEFRNLVEEDRPGQIGTFVDHQHRLWDFLKNHIVVPTGGDAQEALRPLMAFFTRLQLNRTYLNEVEPLLAVLEKTGKDQVWSASYFSQILDVLKPEDEQVAFPLDMLQVILKDELLKAKPIDNAEKDFPQALTIPLKGILKNTTFNRQQQAVLCQLALKEYQYSRNTVLLADIINLLSSEQHEASRDSALQILSTASSMAELENRFNKLRQLLNHTVENETVRGIWEKTTSLWLKAMAAAPREEALFNKVMGKFTDEQSEERSLLFHIIAWSSLQPGLRDKEAYEYELDKKAPKLVDRLSTLSVEELRTLAATYPKQPSPGADDLVRILKRVDDGRNFQTELAAFLKNPHPEVRPDYSHVAKTRAADLRRMFTETRVTDGKTNRPLSATEIARISLMFSELKQLETGKTFIDGYHKPITELSQEELSEAFHRLCKSPTSDSQQVQIWALLFHALGVTTRKYPHMAQQFALIANDVAINAPSRVLKLATGEGKSHFVAMRAAKKAAQGKTATVFTAKRSLAERDLEDYEALFDYLNIKTSLINPKSTRESYTEAQVHYTTLGDLSLFLDEQSYQGKPIDIDPDKTEGLGDELDYTYFDEGRKTEYNYARPTGRTPKQMIWFYQAMNEFYDQNRARLDKEQVTMASARELLTFLIDKAKEDEEKLNFLSQLSRDGLQLVGWLQSAHDAASMERGINFSVVEENVQIGEASYLLKEIIPLTSSNQKAKGSTFSAGVHQLLAVRLNEEAKTRNEAQNYHVHAESHIISSQVANKLLRNLWKHWEGYTGSVSSSQAQALNTEQGTQVLQVSTNQRDLREWHKAKFYQRPEQRIEAMLHQLKHCMANNQSVLFGCKNDKKVLEIKEILKAHLSEEELGKIIFYTNEDEETSSAILERKQRMENWKGGKKQTGITLVASGFGRGDNVGVEAVFIFDTGDVNDLLQTGGRTARNGEEGQVFQFYLEDELKAERRQLKATIDATPGINHRAIEGILDGVPGDNENEKLFSQVMLLREYVFTLQNSANQGFRAGMAQFSGWGLQLISNFLDPVQANEFTNMVTRHIHGLEKQWLSISAKQHLTPTEKVREIEVKIIETARHLQEDYGVLIGKTDGIPAFKFTEAPQIDLVIALEKFTPSDKNTRALASLGSKIAALPADGVSPEAMTEIPKQLDTLASKPDMLQTFNTEAASFQTLGELLDQLNIRVLQITQRSDLYERTKKGSITTPKAESLLKKLSSEQKENYLKLTGKLTPPLQEMIGQWLTEPGPRSGAARIEKILPLLKYLSGFTEAEQKRLGAQYMENIENLIADTPSQLMESRFSGKTMSYSENESLWRLASAFPNHEGELFTLLKEAAEPNYVHRIRMFRRCEDLITRLPEKDRAVFLEHFAKAMTHFSDGVNWDAFSAVVKKTERWWNLDAGKYREDLQNLWRSLAEDLTDAHPPAVASILSQQGKAWFQNLQLAVKTAPEIAIRIQPQQWKTLYDLWRKEGNFTPEQQRESGAVLSKLLTSWLPIPDFDQRVEHALQSYKHFMERGKRENHPNLDKASVWFLTLLNEKPAVLDELDRFVNRPSFTLENLQKNLSVYNFSEQETQALLRMLNDTQMNLKDFSVCCQSLATAKDILSKSTNLSQQDVEEFTRSIPTLSSPNLNILLKTWISFQDNIKANPISLIQSVKYGSNVTLSSERVGLLTKALLIATGSQPQPSPEKLSYIVTGINRFQAAQHDNNDVVKLIGFLERNEFPAEQYLYDNLASYSSTIPSSEQDELKEIIDWFYENGQKHRGNVETLKQLAEKENWYKFDNSTPNQAKNRVIWMHLLNHNAFVTEDLNNGSRKINWSAAKNEKLLEHGLRHYINETQKLLAKKPSASVSLVRDLAPQQQQGLLKLANELEIIGRSHLDLKQLHRQPESQAIRAELEGNLKKIGKKYEASLFKSDSRKHQYASLQRKLDNVRGEGNRYIQLMDVIRTTRNQILSEDILENTIRAGGKKLNRSGHSRIFSTLNQMEDQIVRHWVQDVSALQDFQIYQDRCKEDVLGLAVKLQEMTSAHFDENFSKAPGKGAVSRFIHWAKSTEDNKARIQRLSATLDTFIRDYQTNPLAIEGEALKEFSEKIKDEMSKLPGHLQAVAQEILSRSESLSTHLINVQQNPLPGSQLNE